MRKHNRGHGGRGRGPVAQPEGQTAERGKASNTPSGEALQVILTAEPPFYEAIQLLGIALIAAVAYIEVVGTGCLLRLADYTSAALRS